MALQVPDSLQICKHLNDSNALKPLQFDFYLLLHPNIKPFIQRSPYFNEESHNIEHSNIKRQLYSLSVTINRLTSNLKREKSEVELARNEKLAFIKHQIINNSFEFSIYSICKKLFKLKLKKIAIQIFYLDQKQFDISEILDLLNEESFSQISISISPILFDLEQCYGDKISKIDKKIEYLSVYYENQMKLEMSKDLFIHESSLISNLFQFSNDFNQYFTKLQKEISNNQNTSEPFPFISYGDHLYQVIQKCFSVEIDKIISSALENIPLELYHFCNNIIPNKRSLDENEQIISFFLIYRTVFEYISQMTGDLLKNHFRNEGLIEKFSKIAELPLSKFSFPEYWKLPNPAEKIGVYCRNHPQISQVVNCIQFTLFATNPIDALFSFEKALSMINSILCSIKPDTDILSFDDAFSLFLAAVISSDQSDIVFLSQLINQYLAMCALTPPLEHALATVDAVARYITAFDFSDSKLERNVLFLFWFFFFFFFFFFLN